MHEHSLGTMCVLTLLNHTLPRVRTLRQSWKGSLFNNSWKPMDRGYSKLRTHTALGSYGGARPRGIGPS